MKTAEHKRLAAHRARKANWRLWGPYLSERAWGTVREDYSPDGDAWGFFTHDQARSRVYRWNEDGLCGICDRNQYFCLALSLWNGKDSILKERLFGLTGPEGNHGEDVKECYGTTSTATPTHSYLKMLYKYPQTRFPYEELASPRTAARSALRARATRFGRYGRCSTTSRYFDVDRSSTRRPMNATCS